MAKRRKWIIGVGGSDADDVDISYVMGTENQVKKHLARLVRDARANDPDCFEYGDTSASTIGKNPFCPIEKLYACACFSAYHIDFTAVPDELVETIELK